MAKIRNTTGEDRILPWLGDRLVLDGQVVDVPAEDVYAYTQQEGWAPVDEDAQAIHDEAAERDALVADALVTDELPAGNAKLAEWQAYATAHGVDVEGLTRDQIRDHFNTEES
jgi:hypothetical protein